MTPISQSVPDRRMALGARVRACEFEFHIRPNAFGNALGSSLASTLAGPDQATRESNAQFEREARRGPLTAGPFTSLDDDVVAGVVNGSRESNLEFSSAAKAALRNRGGRISPEDYAPSDRVGAHNSNNPLTFAALARKNAANCATTIDCTTFSMQFSAASNGYFKAASLDQFSAAERDQYKQLGNIYQQAYELANVRAANFAAADVRRLAQEPDWSSNSYEDVAVLSAQTDRAMLASRLSTLNGQIIKSAINDGTLDFRQTGKLGLYNIDQIIAPYVKASTASAPPFEYSPGYYTSACTYEGCFGVRVAYISPAAISAQSDAYDRTHAGTNEYLASAERGMERDFNIATLGLGLINTSLRSLAAFAKLSGASRAYGSVNILNGAIPDANELIAGKYLANYSYDVTYIPTANSQGLQKIRTADLAVSEFNVKNGNVLVGNIDIYTPKSSNANSILRTIEKKDTQATGVIIQINLTPPEMNALALRTWSKPTVKNIDTLFFQDSKGTIIRYNRPSGD